MIEVLGKVSWENEIDFYFEEELGIFNLSTSYISPHFVSAAACLESICKAALVLTMCVGEVWKTGGGRFVVGGGHSAARLSLATFRG